VNAITKIITGKNFFIADALSKFKIIIMRIEELRQRNNQNGQVFLEFILLLALLVSISFGFMKGFRSFQGNRWETMIRIIAKPNNSDINLP
jgi:hypothetical protein